MAGGMSPVRSYNEGSIRWVRWRRLEEVQLSEICIEGGSRLRAEEALNLWPVGADDALGLQMSATREQPEPNAGGSGEISYRTPGDVGVVLGVEH